jgi:hypothetical protein
VVITKMAALQSRRFAAESVGFDVPACHIHGVPTPLPFFD